jgi:hypothetical protein
MKAGLAVTARRGSCTVSAGIDGLFGERASTGIVPQLSIGYGF